MGQGDIKNNLQNVKVALWGKEGGGSLSVQRMLTLAQYDHHFLNSNSWANARKMDINGWARI